MFLKKNVKYRRFKNGFGLSNTVNGKAIVFDEISFYIFMFVVIKKYNVKTVALHIIEKYDGVEFLDALNDVESFLDSLIESDFITTDPLDSSNVNLITDYYTLESAIIELTSDCNLKCKHCINFCSTNSITPSTSDIMTILDDLFLLDTERVIFTGGEPMLRDDICELIDYATSLNIKVILFTNGMLIENDFLDFIKDKDVFLRISIDGHKDKINDYIRGDGSYDRIVMLFKELNKRGMKFGTSTVLTNLTFDYMEDIIIFLTKFKTSEIEISEVFDNGTDEVRKLLLTEHQLIELRKRNIIYSIKYPAFNNGMRMLNKKQNTIEIEENICNAGVKTIHIKSNLDVYPCYLFEGINDALCGNLHKTSVFDIWKSNTFLKELRELRLSDISDCVNCNAQKICAGGCRATALKDNGNLKGTLPGNYCDITRYYNNNKDAFLRDIKEIIGEYGKGI